MAQGITEIALKLKPAINEVFSSTIGVWLSALSFNDALLIAAIILASLFAGKLGMLAYSVFTMPGTICHELAHFFFASLFLAKPSFPSIIPKQQDGYWRLGEVRFAPTIINTAPIALAPLILLPGGIWYAYAFMHPAMGWWYLLHGWVCSTILMAATPSQQDWSIALPGLLIGGGLGFALFLLV